jgi:hypothetical protein
MNIIELVTKPLVKSIPNRKLIQELEILLKNAKEGKSVAIAFVEVYSTGQIATYATESDYFYNMLAGLSILTNRMTTRHEFY